MIPIGFIRTPYRQKFAIPRQPGLVPSAQGRIELINEFANPECLRGLEGYSHIWLIFQFHQTQDQGWSALVRPPRLGGNKKIGVFATRSMFRPNPIGMSVCKLVSTDLDHAKGEVLVQGMDLLDGTPILDIKPYLPYVDNVNDAQAAIAPFAPEAKLAVTFKQDALASLTIYSQNYPDLKQLIIEVLQQDPRPAYRANQVDNKTYSIQLYDLDIDWTVDDRQVWVNLIRKA